MSTFALAFAQKAIAPARVVSCPACELIQNARASCLRCKRPLPVPIINYAPLPNGVHFGDVLPTMAELKDLAIQEAIRRCNGDRLAAARMLQLDKRTLYRITKASADTSARSAHAAE